VVVDGELGEIFGAGLVHLVDWSRLDDAHGEDIGDPLHVKSLQYSMRPHKKKTLLIFSFCGQLDIGFFVT